MKLDNRIWAIVTAIVSLAVLAGGWFLGVQPQLAAASASAQQQASVESQNTASRAQISQLSAAEKKKDALHSQLAELKLSVPPGVDGDGFLSEINALIGSTGVALQNFALQTPVPYVPPVTAAPATPAAGASPSPSPSASASAPPAAATDSTPTIAPVTDPAITAENFITVPMTITVKGPDSAVDQFLSGLQHGDRLVLANSVTKNFDEESGGYTLEIKGFVYVLKDPSSVVADAATTTAAATNG